MNHLKAARIPQTVTTVTTVAAIASILLSGCSSGVLSNLPGLSALTGNPTMTQTIITDAPNDQVLALSLTIDSIRLFDASGKYADVLTTPTTIEASHLDAVQEPLRAPLNISQGTYTSALITVENPIVTYVDATTHKPVQSTVTLAAKTDTVTFASPIVVSATSTPLCFDLLVGQSVTLSGTTATVTPNFSVTQITPSANATNNKNGRLNDVFGSVVSVSGTSLSVLTPNGATVVVTTNSSTTLQGFTSLSSLTAGQLVDIDVAQQSNGTLLAQRIHLANQAPANQLVGPVTAVTGKPVTTFTQTVRQWLGSATTSTTAGTAYTVTVAGTTTFSTNAGTGSLPTLPFTPTFNASTLSVGQNVAVIAGTVTGTTATPTSVTLVPQTVGGTVSAIATLSGGFSAYTITLPTGSALGNLTGATSVVVYSNATTQFMNSGTIAVGSTVRFNGLLFNDAGTLRLLSGTCSDGEPPAPPQKH